MAGDCWQRQRRRPATCVTLLPHTPHHNTSDTTPATPASVNYRWLISCKLVWLSCERWFLIIDVGVDQQTGFVRTQVDPAAMRIRQQHCLNADHNLGLNLLLDDFLAGDKRELLAVAGVLPLTLVELSLCQPQHYCQYLSGIDGPALHHPNSTAQFAGHFIPCTRGNQLMSPA